MLLRLFFIFIVFFQIIMINAQDISSMDAVQMNTKGFNLYNEKKYEESLKYFKASFEKDQDYSFSHYNYACVLSILKRDKEVIREHLLRAFFLNPDFRKKYFSDPDLEWFRQNSETNMQYSEYFQLGNYKLDINIELLKRSLTNGEKGQDYDFFDLFGNTYPGAYLTIKSSGKVPSMGLGLGCEW